MPNDSFTSYHALTAQVVDFVSPLLEDPNADCDHVAKKLVLICSSFFYSTRKMSMFAKDWVYVWSTSQGAFFTSTRRCMPSLGDLETTSVL